MKQIIWALCSFVAFLLSFSTVALCEIPQTETRTADSKYPTEKGIYGVKDGMPKNTRHLKEGYWIGAMPTPDNIDTLYAHGIRAIVTLAKGGRKWRFVKARIDSLGIEHVYMPIGSHFPNDDSFYGVLSKYSPNQIFIHCAHGSDRSGAFVAYMLIRSHEWTPQRALLAMLNPSRVDLMGLKQVLHRHGYSFSDEDLFYLGMYSGARNRGTDGLKVSNERYQRLVSTMLESVKSF